MEAIVPIFKQLSDGQFKFIGTGFFISVNGILVSAKHVLLDVFENGQQNAAIGILQLFPNNHYTIRRFLRCTTHETADVGIAIAAPLFHYKTQKPFLNKILTISKKELEPDDLVHTYAYPTTTVEQNEKQTLNVQALYFDGKVTEVFPNGRDRILLPAPCYQTTMNLHGGSSGGPVFNSKGQVCGINSTGFDGCLDISFVSRIQEILNLKLTDIKINSESESRDVHVNELIDLKHVIIK